MKKCMNCGCNLDIILITLTDACGETVMCPNCIAAGVLNGSISFTANKDLIDDITGMPGAVKFVSRDESYTLTPRTMLRLLAHDLRPHEWKTLAAKYDVNAYMLHDDFYTSDGEAWQPTEHIHVYEWRDIVEISGKHYTECFEISGEKDDPVHYRIDDFLAAVAFKHGVDPDDVRTYTMDDIAFDPAGLSFGAEACGCYIDGVPEWLA